VRVATGGRDRLDGQSGNAEVERYRRRAVVDLLPVGAGGGRGRVALSHVDGQRDAADLVAGAVLQHRRSVHWGGCRRAVGGRMRVDELVRALAVDGSDQLEVAAVDLTQDLVPGGVRARGPGQLVLVVGVEAGRVLDRVGRRSHGRGV